MSDVGVDVLAKWRVVPENVVSLSVFAFGKPQRATFARNGLRLANRLATATGYVSPSKQTKRSSAS